MGRAAAQLFLERGWKVLIGDINLENGKKTIEDFKNAGYENCYFVQCNVGSDSDMKKAYEFALEKLGGIDSLINNAGIWHGGMLHETEEDQWNRLFDIDVKSVYLSAKYFIPDMIKRRYGTVINTVSVSGLYGDYNMAAYNAAKGALTNLVKSMALDYGKYGIRVNNVCPSACAKRRKIKKSPLNSIISGLFHLKLIIESCIESSFSSWVVYFSVPTFTTFTYAIVILFIE
ncbi:MAG: SDR family NAD(P)-dependent oxidoreductase [Fusobacteriaceae bacterium]